MTKAKYALLKKFFSQYPSEKFKKNTVLFKPGDKIENVYFLKSGFVRAFTKTASTEHTLNLFKPLFLISLAHQLTNIKNNLFLQTITPIEVYVIPKLEFKKIYYSNPEISPLIMDFYFTNLMSFINNQGKIVNGNALNRIASILLQLAYDYGQVKQNHVIVNFPATHRIIANLIGLTRETTSVQMSRLQKMKVITSKRTQFTIIDLPKLQSLAKESD